MNQNRTQEIRDWKIREIWKTMDQSSIDAMQDDPKKPSEETRASNEIYSFSTERNVAKASNNSKKDDSSLKCFGNQYPINLLSSRNSENLIDFKDEDHGSLQSIWTPTTKDKIPTYTQPYILQEEKKLPSQKVHENNNTEKEFYQLLTISSSESEISEYSEIEDNINEQTFGKYAEPVNQEEWTLIDISEETEASSQLLKKELASSSTSKDENYKTKRKAQNYKDMTGNTVAVEKTSPFESEALTQQKKFHKETSLKKGPKCTSRAHKGINRSGEKTLKSEFSQLSVSDNGTYVRKESTQKRYSSNHSKDSWPKYSRKTIKKTREFFNEGNICRQTVEKTVYIGGKKVENVKETTQNISSKNIIWKSDISIFEDEREISSRPKNYKYKQRRPRNSMPLKEKSDSINQNKHKPERTEKDCNEEANLFRYNNNLVGKPFDQGMHCDRHSSSNGKTEFMNSEKQESTVHKKDLSKNNSNLYKISENNSSYVVNLNESVDYRSQDERYTARESKRVMTPINGNSYGVIDEKYIKEDYPSPHQFNYSTSTDAKGAFESVKENPSNHNNPNFNSPPLIENFNSECRFEKVDNEKVVKYDRKTKDDILEVKKPITRELKSVLIRDGKELADLIAGSDRSYELFKSHYDEWVDVRTQCIALLEQIVGIITNSKKKTTIRGVIQALNIAANMAVAIPHPGIAVGARIVAGVAGIFGKMFPDNGPSKDDIDEKEYVIKQTFQKDMNTSSNVYMYGMMCGTQFEETCNFTKKFHEKLLSEDYKLSFADADILEFFDEISEYNVSNAAVFYRRLQKAYERLIMSSKSDESKAFIRVLEDVPDALGRISFLPWRFESDGFDNSIVENEWQELFNIFNSDDAENIDAFSRSIRNCLYFLKKERDILTHSVRDLFK